MIVFMKMMPIVLKKKKKSGFPSSSCLDGLPLHHMLCFLEMAFTVLFPSEYKETRERSGFLGKEGPKTRSVILAMLFISVPKPFGLDLILLEENGTY